MVPQSNDRLTLFRMLGTVLVSGGFAILLLSWPLGKDASPPAPPRSREVPAPASAPASAPAPAPSGAPGGIQIINGSQPAGPPPGPPAAVPDVNPSAPAAPEVIVPPADFADATDDEAAVGVMSDVDGMGDSEDDSTVGDESEEDDADEDLDDSEAEADGASLVPTLAMHA